MKKRWASLNERRTGHFYGMVIDDPLDPLTNLRFADDVLLIAASRGDVGKMIADLGKETATYGLKMNMGKTKVITNSMVRKPSSVQCHEQEVQILTGDETEKYLGRKLSINDYHSVEMHNRLASGWACFFKFKDVLCNWQLPLKDRIKLFEATVVPCVLYACGAWTLRAETERRLRSARRRMLRWMVRIRKHLQEDLTEYMKPATHTNKN